MPWLALLGCLLLPGVALTEERETGKQGFKCWKNHEGVRECGTTVPPEFAQQGHQRIDRLGNVREEVGAALTPEQLDARDAAALEEMRQEQERKKKKRQDQALLQTFSRVEDIETSLQDKLAVLRSNITLLEARNKRLREKLEKDLAMAEEQKQKGEGMSQNLSDAIQSQRNQVQNNEEGIEAYKQQMRVASQKAEMDITRFRELTE